MAQNRKKIPFIYDIPLYPGEWPRLRNFLVEIKEKLQKLMGDPTVPGQISGHTLSTQSYAGAIQITWEKVPNAQSYRIYRNTVRDLSTATVVAEVFGFDTQQYIDSILVSGTYFYWISSINALGFEGVPVDLTDIDGAVIIAQTSVVTTVTALKALQPPATTILVSTQGYYAAGDGGHGIYRWNSSDTAADNGGTVIIPDSSPASGRWNLLHDNRFNVKQFGAKSDDTGDQSTAIAAAYTALPSDGGTLYFPAGIYRNTSSISFATTYKKVLLEGAPGSATTLKYTGTTGTFLTFNYGNDGTYPLSMAHGLRGLNIIGAANNNSSKGIIFGGSNGAQGFSMKDCRLSTFGTGLELGSHTWITSFDHCMIRDCTTLLITPSGLTEAGENLSFVACTFADSVSPHTDAVWIKGDSHEVNFQNCSFDQAQLSVGNSTSNGAQVTCDACHFENPNLGTVYDFFKTSNHASNYLRLTNCFAFQAKSSSPPTQLGTFNGGKVYIAGFGMFTNATLTNFAVLANAVGLEIYGFNDLSGAITTFLGGSTTGFVVNFAGANTGAGSRNFVIGSSGVGGDVFDVTGSIRASSQVKALVATGTAPLSVNSTTPVTNLTAQPALYNTSGTQQNGIHMVTGVATLSGGTVSVSLSGSAVFSTINSYVVVATDINSANPVQTSRASGSSFTINGTGTDQVDWIAIGT